MPPKKTAPPKGGAKPKAAAGSKAPVSTKAPSADKKAAEKPAPAAAAPPPVVEIGLKQLANVLFTGSDPRVKESGRWPLVIDPSENASTFLRYRDTNYVNTVDPTHVDPDRLRLALLGAIWVLKLVRKGDGEMYSDVRLDESRWADFQLIIMTKIEPQESLARRMVLVRIV